MGMCQGKKLHFLGFHKRQHVILILLFKFVLSDRFPWLEENEQNREGGKQDY